MLFNVTHFELFFPECNFDLNPVVKKTIHNELPPAGCIFSFISLCVTQPCEPGPVFVSPVTNADAFHCTSQLLVLLLLEHDQMF